MDQPTAATSYRGLQLDGFQLEAISAIEAGHTVLLAAPTGAGKTVIAEYAIEQALERGQRAIYTSPIKALSNQKYRDFGERYPGQVGLVTGDVSLDPDARVLIMTTEIFRNAVIDAPGRYEDVAYAIFDEVHYINDLERGTVWEESIICAPESIRFVALSATIPNVEEIGEWIADVRHCEVSVIVERERPVPLEYRYYQQKAGHFGHSQLKRHFRRSRFDVRRARKGAVALLDECVRERRLPCLYFAFNRKECEAKGWVNRNRRLLSDDEREQLETLIDELCERYGVSEQLEGSRELQLWRRGIAYHHAGMLPMAKEIVERLFSAGLIKLLFATETFALGVNMPAQSVVFDSLEKFDGTDFRPLKVLEFQQMAGRAGRRGMDTRGFVHINLDAVDKLDMGDLRRITSGRVEPIKSQLNLGYATILNLRGRLGDEGLFRVAGLSLSRFQSRRAGKRDVGADKHRRRQLEGRLALLADLGYLGPDGSEEAVTPRGRFAAQVQGYELQVGELFFHGDLEDLDQHELAVVFAALIFEGKKRTWFSPRYNSVVKPLEKVVNRRLRNLRKAEAAHRIDELSKPADFQIGGPVLAWSRGAPLYDVAELTSMPPGDLVRSLRLTVMLLRQARHAARGHASLAGRLADAVEALKRDEADAEAQLRVG